MHAPLAELAPLLDETNQRVLGGEEIISQTLTDPGLHITVVVDGVPVVRIGVIFGRPAVKGNSHLAARFLIDQRAHLAHELGGVVGAMLDPTRIVVGQQAWVLAKLILEGGDHRFLIQDKGIKTVEIDRQAIYVIIQHFAQQRQPVSPYFREGDAQVGRRGALPVPFGPLRVFPEKTGPAQGMAGSCVGGADHAHCGKHLHPVLMSQLGEGGQRV